LVDLCVCVSVRLRSRHPNEKIPTFSGKWASDDGYAAEQTL